MDSPATLQGPKFVLFSCQAVLFTAADTISAAAIMSELFPQWSTHFNADPVVLPTAEGLPAEVPRVILQDHSESWRFELAPARANLIWRQSTKAPATIGLDDFFARAVALLIEYKTSLSLPVHRVAAIVGRYSLHDRPGLALSRHFCKEQWYNAPLNRPEGFELHAHKAFLLDKWKTINSWARNKTGAVRIGSDQKPAIVFEQDLNSLAEEAAGTSWSSDDIAHFFHAARRELDVILQLYYPGATE